MFLLSSIWLRILPLWWWIHTSCVLGTHFICSTPSIFSLAYILVAMFRKYLLRCSGNTCRNVYKILIARILIINDHSLCQQLTHSLKALFKIEWCDPRLLIRILNQIYLQILMLTWSWTHISHLVSLQWEECLCDQRYIKDILCVGRRATWFSVKSHKRYSPLLIKFLIDVLIRGN